MQEDCGRNTTFGLFCIKIACLRIYPINNPKGCRNETQSRNDY